MDKLKIEDEDLILFGRQSQDEVRSYVIERLRAAGRRPITDEHGNVYVLPEIEATGIPVPWVVAHMDTVHDAQTDLAETCRIKPVRIGDTLGAVWVTPKDGFRQTGVGGDDKCGVLAALKLHEKWRDKIGLLFTVDEEIGGIGAQAVASDLFSYASCWIQLDRAGAKDLVCHTNGIFTWSPGLAEIIVPLAARPEFARRATTGSFTDVGVLARRSRLPAVNISAGYYNPHSYAEYVKLDELESSILFADALITGIEASPNLGTLADERVVQGRDWYKGVLRLGYVRRAN